MPALTIRRQLTRLVAASVLPAALAAGILIVYSYERQRSMIERRTLETARAMAQAVDRELASGQAALRALATSPFLDSGDIAAFRRQAEQALSGLPGDNFVLSDRSGKQVMNTLRPPGAPLPLHGNLDQLRRVFETGQPVISDLFVGGVTRRPLIALDFPVRRNGEVIYDLSLGIFPERLAGVLSAEKLPAGWVGSIFDSHGTIVARTHDPGKYVGRKGAPQLLERMAQTSEGHVDTDTLEGIPVVAVFSRSTVSNWSVAIGVPRSLLWAYLWTPIAWILAGALVLLVFGMALAYRISSRISQAVRGLIEPASALGRGEAVALRVLPLEEANEVGRALVSASKTLQDRQRILATVSHDLRNPLNSLMVGTSLALRLAEDLPGSETLRDRLAVQLDTVRSMSGMVDDLLAVAVSTSGGRSMLKLAPVSASSLVVRAAEAIRPLFAREGIDLDLDCGAALPHVRADAERVLRVFVNLLDNALKFTSRPGRVVLAAQARPGAVLFSVANTGRALSTEELGRMFQVFWQAASEDRRGAGLGLSICRSIIDAHGGRIWAEPEPGKRVRICFELPLAAAPVATGAGRKESANSQDATGPAASLQMELWPS